MRRDQGLPPRLVYVLGTRPEIIRSARTLDLLGRTSEVRTTVVNTGQHYDHSMMDAFFQELKVASPDFNLKVGSWAPAEQTAEVIARFAKVLIANDVDAVCVFGDTNSSLGAAIAALKCNVPIIHIEAGCRSADMRSPEENNRRIIDHVSGLLLTMSRRGAENLLEEHVTGHIVETGDPQYDVFTRTVTRLARRPQAGAMTGLVTMHRAENVDCSTRLFGFLEALDAVANEHAFRWIFPVHPRTAARLQGRVPGSFQILPPLGYRELLEALRSARLCVTDSGGLQKEALWMRVPCVTVQVATAWPETVEQGANVLAPEPTDLPGAVRSALLTSENADFSNPFGDGNAAEKIVQAIVEFVGGLSRRSSRAPG